MLPVGKTLTINLSLNVGGLEETVRVTAESPLVDTTSAKVGGNIGTAELSELPAMNRNYFATVALLPGVQFSPSNQMGNDTIVAAGQSTQGNNVSVDGGYNGDDALGTSSGAQVRTPLEAIQEFQVITSMYDAEWGRASGAIVNAVTKAGTNQFKGVVFGELASNALTAEDYFVRTQNLEKPTSVRRDWGGVLGGPIVKNKAHFFFSLERQVDNPNRTRTFRVAAVAELRDRRGPHRLEHADPLRPPDQQEQHLGDAVAARVGAAVVDGAGRQELGADHAGRDRPGSDGGRHADDRARQLAGQHRQGGPDVGALVARQRMLPRPGSQRRTGWLRLRQRADRQSGALPAAAELPGVPRPRPAPSRRVRGIPTTRSRTTTRGSCPGSTATTT